MEYTFYRLSLLLVLSLTATSADAANKVYLLGGQSNMRGLGNSATIPATYKKATGVKCWDGSKWVNLQSAIKASKSFGPEVGFGYAIKKIYPKDTIYLIKYAVSGASLASDWNPDGNGQHGNGVAYNTFKTTVKSAIENLTVARVPYTIDGMLWMQGETDACSKNTAPKYEDNLKNLITRVRSDFNAPDMRFIIGRIMPSYGTSTTVGSMTCSAIVRGAEATVGNTVPNCAWFDTDDLPLGSQGHWGTTGQIELGIRFAKAMQTPEQKRRK